MNEKKNPTWVSQYEIVEQGLMLSPQGITIKKHPTVKKYITMFKSFHQKKNARGVVTSYVTLAEIKSRNKSILKNQYVANKLQPKQKTN